MGRTSRIGSALLLCAVLTAGGTAPPAAATEPGTGQSTVPQVVWGSCARFIGDAAADLPTAQCTTVPVPDRRRESRWATSTIGRDQDSGERPAHRCAVRQPRRSGRIGGRRGRRDGRRAGGQPDQRALRPRRLRPARRRLLDPGARCRTDAEFDAWRRNPMVDYSPAGVAAIEQIYRNYTAECADKLGTAFLASVGTDSAAKDMDTHPAGARRRHRSTTWASATAPSWAPNTSTGSRTGSARWCSTAPSTPPRTPSTRSSSRWPASRRPSPTTPPTARSRPAARWEPIRRSG